MPIALNKNRIILFALSFLFLFALSAPAFGAGKVVARLDSFSGKVLIKSQGSWGVEPEVNLPVGTHIITLTVTDNAGAKGTDTVIITVELPPVVTPMLYLLLLAD